jgi:hypothetical protein
MLALKTITVMCAVRISVWVWNLVCDVKGVTYTEGVRDQGAEEDIWTEEG